LVNDFPSAGSTGGPAFEIEDGGPTPGIRRPLPWTELSINAARVRRRKDGGSVFVVCDGRLAGSRRVTFFLTLADCGSSFALERGIALMRAIIKAGSEPAAIAKHETLLAAAARRLTALRPIEVTGALVEQSGTFISRLEIDAVRAVSATTTLAEAAQ
jgi:hypothetical protein